MGTKGLKWGNLPTSAPGPAPSRRAGKRSKGRESEVRAAELERFRQAIASGTYRVDGLTIADRLIEHRVFDDSTPE